MEKITLILPIEQVNTIMQALGELPAKMSFETMANINSQVMAQLPPLPETAAGERKGHVSIDNR